MRTFVLIQRTKNKVTMALQYRRSLSDKETGSVIFVRTITIPSEAFAIDVKFSFEIKMIFLLTKKANQRI